MVKKEILVCNICKKEIPSTDAYYEMTRWKEGIKLDVCKNCYTEKVMFVLYELKLTTQEFESELVKVIKIVAVVD